MTAWPQEWCCQAARYRGNNKYLWASCWLSSLGSHKNSMWNISKRAPRLLLLPKAWGRNRWGKNYENESQRVCWADFYLNRNGLIRFTGHDDQTSVWTETTIPWVRLLLLPIIILPQTGQLYGDCHLRYLSKFAFRYLYTLCQLAYAVFNLIFKTDFLN